MAEEESEKNDSAESSIYGDSAQDWFRKTLTAKRLGVDQAPDVAEKLKGPTMAIIFMMTADFFLFLIWMLSSQAAPWRWSDFVDTFNGTDDNEVGQLWNKDNISKLYSHMYINAVIFIVLMPLIMLINVVWARLKSFMLNVIFLVTKIVVFFFFFGAWCHITDLQVVPQSQNLQVHGTLGHLLYIVFIFYVFGTGVRVSGFFFPIIFKTRLIGHLLRVATTDTYHSAMTHMLHYMALLTMVSGLLPYHQAMQRLLNEKHEGHINPPYYWSTNQSALYLFVMIFHLLHFVIFFTNYGKHYIKYHTCFITKDEFRKHFLEFKHLYIVEDESEDDPNGDDGVRHHHHHHGHEAIPRVTAPVQRI